MILLEKYEYLPIQRTDSEFGRSYLVAGKPLPSVTTILSATKDNTHLDEWKKAVGEVKAEQIKNESSTLGSAMHTNIENYIFKKPYIGSFMAKALADVIIKNGLKNVSEVWASEAPLFYRDLYAGTTDLIGLHAGQPAIIDFKNSLGEKKKEWIEDYFLQLAAYAMAHNEMFGTSINRGVIMMATRDAKYLEFVVEGEEFSHYETLWAGKVCAYYDSLESR